MLHNPPNSDDKNKAIRVLDRWINMEFLSQESQDYKDLKGDHKKVEKIDLRNTDYETASGLIKDKLNEIRRKKKKSAGVETTIIYGHIDRKKYTDYLNRKYPKFSKNINVSFGEWDYIEFGRSTYYYDNNTGVEVNISYAFAPLFMADHFLEEDPDVSFDSSFYKKYGDYIHEKHPGEFGLLKEFVRQINDKKKKLNDDAATVYMITTTNSESKEAPSDKPASFRRTSYIIDDLQALRDKISNDEFGSTAYEASVLRLIIDEHLDTDDELRVNITHGNSDVDPLFRKYLDKSCYPVGKWPKKRSEEGGLRRPYLMQQLAINLFEAKKAEELPIFSVNGPPGTGKTTMLKEIVADIVTKKVRRMAQLLKENNYDPDKLLENDELLQYSIAIASQNNAAVKNITSEYPEGLKDDKDHPGLPLMAALGNNQNFILYGGEESVRLYRDRIIKLADKSTLKRDVKRFIDLYEQVEQSKNELKGKKDPEEILKEYHSDTVKDYEQAQRSNPYDNDDFDELREKLFISAWKLHQKIAWSSPAIREAFIRYYDAKEEVDDSEEDKYVSRSIFFVSPAVSSTFASFERLFLYSREKASCGVLIVDESGQVQTKDAAGALMRARRAMIVGDPKQIPPVVPPYQKYAYEFYRQDETDIKMITEDDIDDCNFNEDDVPSLQRSADAINPYGTYIGNTWVGCPLVLHKRCISPMFNISNDMSYAGTMIKNTQDPSEEDAQGFIFDRSYWIQVKGREGDGKKNHFVLRQAEVVHKLIRKKCGREKGKKHVSLFVITPFKSVVEGMKNYINHHDPELNDFAKTNIGTIHTFQGKEADEVILVLGCSSESEAAARWISKNMVNVAASRAKYRLYIVGDMDLFRRREGQPESPVNQARLIMQKHYKKLELGDCKLGLKDINDLLELGGKNKVGTRKEKKQYKCPRCGRSVIKKSNGWFCNYKCGMQFKINGYPIDSNSIGKLLSENKDVWVAVSRQGKRYHLYPDKIVRSRDKDDYEYDASEYKDLGKIWNPRLPKSKIKNKADYLYCNCSTFINKFRKETRQDEVLIDYFDIMILDAIYTIQEVEKKTNFNSYDILVYLTGKSDPDPQSPVRDEINNRICKMILSNIYDNVKNVKADGTPWKYYLLPQIKQKGKNKHSYAIDTGTEGEYNSYLFKYIQNQTVRKSIVMLPYNLLDGRYAGKEKKNEPIFPVKEEWLMIKYYLLYRIALIYRVKKINNIISFDTMKKSLHLEKDVPVDRVKNMRFKSRIKAYMSFLKRKKYIKDFEIIESLPRDDVGYCGIKEIRINNGIRKERRKINELS